MTTAYNLQDLTAHEAGAVVYPDGSIWVGNWTQINGIPRQFASVGMIGLGEQIKARKCAVPAAAKLAMQQHEHEQGDDVSRSGFKAWRTADNHIIVINWRWN